MSEAVRDGVTGLLVTPDRPAELAAAFEKLIHDVPLRRMLGDEVRRRTGLDVAERLRSLSDVPVVFLTAYSDERLVIRAVSSGSFGFLVKPFQPQLLRANIEMALEKHRLQQELRESRRKLEQAAHEKEQAASARARLANAALGVTHWEFDFSADRFNYFDRYQELFGVSGPDHTLSKIEAVELIAEDDRPLVRDATLKAIQLREDFQCEFRGRVTQPNGLPRWYASRARVERDHSGQPIRLQGIVWEITQRKQTEEALRSSEAEARKLARIASRTHNSVILTDAAGRIEWVNDGFNRMTGYTLDEVRGRTPGSFLQGSESDPQTNEEMRRAVIAGREFTAEIVNYHKSGRTFWVRIEAQPIFNDSGQLTYFMAIESDISERKRADESLRSSEATKQAMLNALPDLIFLLDSKGRFLEYHTAQPEDFHVSPSEFQGRTILEVLPAGIAKDIAQCADQVIQTGEAKMLEYSLPMSNKTSFFEARFVPCELNRVLVAVRNITERKRAEILIRELNESLERRVQERTAELQTILDSVPALIFYKNREHRLVRVNEAHARCYGLPKEQMEGKTDAELGSPYASRYIADDLKVMTTGKPLHNLIEQIYTPAETRWIQTEKVPFRDMRGNVIGVIGLAIDITERLQAEEKLREKENILSQSQEIAHIGSWGVDLGANRVTWTDETYRLYGVSPETFVPSAKAILDLLHPDDRCAAQQHIRAFLSGNNPGILEFRVPQPDGSTRILSGQAQLIHDDGNQLVRIIGTVQDITERKQAEEQARELRDALAHATRLGTLGEIASGLAHELNQPLGAIHMDASSAQLLAEKFESAGLQNCLKRIGEQSLRAGEIIRRMRSFIRRDSSRKAPDDINRLVREVLMLLADHLHQNSVQAEMDLAEHLPSVVVDGIQIQQVLVNLIRNASDAMAQNVDRARVVSIRTEMVANEIRVGVTDTGCGVDPAVNVKLFFPFQSTKSTGLGLGLAICRTLIEAHDGRINARSNPEGGTTFFFELPAAQEQGVA